MIELVSPAGSLEKLKFAYHYGADAAYIGLQHFSLRANAENFDFPDHQKLVEIKKNKKLYCALNIYFHNKDIKNLELQLETIRQFPFDAWIISDLGVLHLIRKMQIPISLHLSTQANCLNTEAVKFYRDLGFSRIILGRECSLQEIHAITSAVPDVELEIFVHGAMCLAYAGRCFLSKWMADRSSNQGDCAHSCRWQYRVLNEASRPNEYYPVLEQDEFTTILSSKDLCMIRYMQDIYDAGVKAVKIEGRMKSVYYAAIVTRAYRKALDQIAARNIHNLEDYIQELWKVSYREMSTGFYFDKDQIQAPTEKSYTKDYLFLGIIGQQTAANRFCLDVRNTIHSNQTLEFVGPNIPYLTDTQYKLLDSEDKEISTVHHSSLNCRIQTELPVEPGFLIRIPTDKT